VIDSDLQSDSSNNTSNFPWPPRETDSVLDALATTWKESVFHPTSFFRRMPREFDFGWVIGYYMLIGIVTAGITLFWQMVLGPSPWQRILLNQGGDAGSPFVDFLLSPLLLLVGLLLAAGIVHLFLLMVRGAQHGFGTTLRVFCFSIGPQIFCVVPFVGAAVGGFWSLVITVIGLREAHETTTGRALAGLLIPLFLLVLLAGLLMMAMFVAGVGSLRV
jgi:hypothetical protein